MHSSISKKLFTITFGLLLSLMFITMLFQTLFFENFYLATKSKQLKNEISKLSEFYSNQGYSDESILRALTEFENRTNTKVAICSLNGNYKYATNSKKGLDDKFILSDMFADIFTDKDTINIVIKNGEIVSRQYGDNRSSERKIGIIAPFSLFSDRDAIIVCVSSIQPITEASTVIRDFYKYILLGVILIGGIMTIVYTNLITKPLLKINKVAQKMSSMDFTSVCEVNSDDELGNLGSTLNFLSANLNTALEDLKNKNKKLEEDIENERNLENLRKDFVASVSHELKTPIGIIEGYAEGIKDGIVTGENSKLYLDTIIDEAKKMGKLVSTMLELSKLESGTVILNIETFNVLRLLKKVITTLTINLENKNLTVNYNTSLPYAYVDADSFQVEQVVTNLLTNAYKYSPENSSINIDVIEKEDTIYISIENTGINIPEHELENIYTKFYRLDKSRNRSSNSTGLGLAIVQRILDLHSSQYKMYNTSNGVKFEFNLVKSKDIQ